jgi:hypothetical protein
MAADVRERWQLALQLEWEARNAVRLAAAAASATAGAAAASALHPLPSCAAAVAAQQQRQHGEQAAGVAAATFAAAALRAARGWREALERGADAAATEAYATHRDAWGGTAHVVPPLAPQPPPQARHDDDMM